LKLREAFAPGREAVVRNWMPIVVIQGVAFAIVIVYNQSNEVQRLADSLETWKVRGGIPFAFLAGAIAGGVVPEIAKFVTGRLRRFDRTWFADSLFNAFAYGLIGILVDLFYRLQTLMFGSGRDLGTLVLKTVVDMAIFSPLIAIPFTIWLYECRKLASFWQPLRALFTIQFLESKVMPVLISAWAFWIPILLLVYSLPTNLQFCFSILAEAAWSIIFVFMATRPSDPVLANS
jgi:hypothetical protein